MKSNYRCLSDYIEPVKVRNNDLQAKELLGININKHFMPSVANIVGTDLSNYKLVQKNQFACNRMHVGRDYRIPIAVSKNDEPFMVSPAYDVFEIKDPKTLLPEYLMMWFERSEFDRNAWFYTDADVRGGLAWQAFENMQLPIPNPNKQMGIVKEYNVIKNRLELNQQLIQKLEETAQAIYREWFVEFEFLDENGKPYKSNGGEMIWCEKLKKEIPLGWEIASIGKYSKVKSGFAFKSEWWQSSGIPVIKIGSINNNTIDKNSLNFVSTDKLEKAKKYRVQEGDIVIAMTGATIGKIGLVPKLNDSILVNQRVGMFDLGKKPTEKTAFLYFNLLNDFVQNEIKNVGGDSAQANISNGQIQEIEMLYPTSNLILNFNRIGKPIIETILRIIAENQKLMELKELLLSKLATIEN
jgi:type I restriction enzyme S subunit